MLVLELVDSLFTQSFDLTVKMRIPHSQGELCDNNQLIQEIVVV
jgi:hypothetical protein